jgi:hypothetical protein
VNKPATRQALVDAINALLVVGSAHPGQPRATARNERLNPATSRPRCIQHS